MAIHEALSRLDAIPRACCRLDMTLFQINPTNKRLGNDELEKIDTVQKEDIFL
jgi:hypothetical protein